MKNAKTKATHLTDRTDTAQEDGIPIPAPPADLASIRAPRIVGLPPSNAMSNLVELPDGSLRCYGPGGFLEGGDAGLTWTERPLAEGAVSAFATARSPVSGDDLGIVPVHKHGGPWYEKSLMVRRFKQGLDHPPQETEIGRDLLDRYADAGGSGGARPDFFLLPESTLPPYFGNTRPPLFIRGGQRILVCNQMRRPDSFGISSLHPMVRLSDDDGHTWRPSFLETVGPHPVSWPDRGMRWENFVVEPTVIELNDGRLWMLLRTSTDHLYEAFSEDGGEHWTTPRPSRFYAHKTMPTLHRLADGRMLLLWTNSAILPEDHRHLSMDEQERLARSTHAFTNRDVLHAAISNDDGVTWRGFRELLLNPVRNDPDFATGHGGTKLSVDKSVHQAQAVNLPHGKVLVAAGQHPACRRLLIFDPDWLLETDRSDDFSDGLENWSTFQYVAGVKGHAAWDRKPGGGLIPHPEDSDRQVLWLRRVRDEALVSDVQGAVWNFPAGAAGEMTVRLRLREGSRGLRISLLDRWVNPSDALAHRLAMFNLTVLEDGRSGYLRLAPERWYDLRITWVDIERGSARLSIDGIYVGMLPLLRPGAHGISYLLLQSTDDGYDEAGFVVEHVRVRICQTS